MTPGEIFAAEWTASGSVKDLPTGTPAYVTKVIAAMREAPGSTRLTAMRKAGMRPDDHDAMVDALARSTTPISVLVPTTSTTTPGLLPAQERKRGVWGELTDAGTAERFVARNRLRVRYVHRWDQWHVWDESRWAPDDRREVYRLAIETARGIHADAALADSKGEAQEITRHALTSERRDRIEATLALARTMPPLALVPDELDADPHILVVPNGVVDLKRGKLEPHDRRRLVTKCAPVPFDAEAAAPLWEAFLARIVPDADVRAYLQRAVGYSLTGDVSEHALFFAYGTGANGKSTFLETIRDLLGEGEYAKAAAPDLLLAKKQDRHAAEVADLRGARFVTTIEVQQGRAWDEARVKWLTGGDAISARFMYGNPFTFQPTHKFWIAGNHKPRVSGTDHGFWRRVHTVPFTVTIPKPEQDGELRHKLKAELPGILRWAVEGCSLWSKYGLQPPDAVRAATAQYRDAEDVIGAFLDECCDIDPGSTLILGGLYDVYRAWAERGGEHALTKRRFGDALEDRGIERVKATAGRRALRGIRLKAQAEGAE